MKPIILVLVAISALGQTRAQAPRAGPGGSTAKWGGITGNLPDQTDLQTELLKMPKNYTNIVDMFNMSGKCTGFLKNDGTCTTSAGVPTWGQIQGDITQQQDLAVAINNRAPAFTKSTLTSGTTYQLTNADNGITLVFNNAGTVTLTIPGNLQAGFSCLAVQLGGQITIVGNGSAVHQRQNLTKSAGMYAVVSIIAYGPNTYVLSGDMQ